MSTGECESWDAPSDFGYSNSDATTSRSTFESLTAPFSRHGGLILFDILLIVRKEIRVFPDVHRRRLHLRARELVFQKIYCLQNSIPAANLASDE